MKLKAKARWKALPLSHTFYSAGGMDQVGQYLLDKALMEPSPELFAFLGCVWRDRGAYRLHPALKGEEGRQGVEMFVLLELKA